MKTKFYSLFALVTLSFGAIAQGVGINETGAAPDPAAGLDINFNNKVFLPPRLTTEQRNGILSAPTGAMIYNITLACLQVNDGTPASPIWNCISNGAGIPDGTIATLNCAGATNNGTLTEGQAASGVNSVIAYTGGNGGAHGGQVIISTGVTGLTATLNLGIFTSGAGNLTYTITGTPTTTGTASFAINIGGQSCTLTRTVAPTGVPNICNLSNPTAIVDVTNGATGKTWMDRNLGANRAATSSTDVESYGSLYQWGRGSDGHQCVNRYAGDGVTTSANTALDATVSTDTPPHGDFILTNAGINDWRSPQNNNLWQGTGGTNNPCPTGYRLPTESELNAERVSWSSNNSAGAFASPLKFSMAGNRNHSNGLLLNAGSFGFYWSSTVSSTNARNLSFMGFSTAMSTNNRSFGFSVRCIKN
jgi:uncharacterized protein (TIGR02145 family)